MTVSFDRKKVGRISGQPEYTLAREGHANDINEYTPYKGLRAFVIRLDRCDFGV